MNLEYLKENGIEFVVFTENLIEKTTMRVVKNLTEKDFENHRYINMFGQYPVFKFKGNV